MGVQVWPQGEFKAVNLFRDRRSLPGWVHLMDGTPRDKMCFGIWDSLYPATLVKRCCVLPNPNLLALHNQPSKVFSSKVFSLFQFWACGFTLRPNLHDLKKKKKSVRFKSWKKKNGVQDLQVPVGKMGLQEMCQHCKTWQFCGVAT